jgi:enoyl-CoA hydratase/carnithine racemase
VADNDLIRYEPDGAIANIWLNRPEKLNALSDNMILELRRRLDQFDLDGDLRLAIIRGEGRAFCAGADVRQRQLRPREELIKYGAPGAPGARTRDLFVRMIHNKPVIAAVHGYVVGAGLSIALGADLIVAADDARFQITEVKRGVDGARYWSLIARRAGEAFANDVAMTARFWSADEALARGIVNRVVIYDQLDAAARELAATVLSNPPLAVRQIVKRRRIEMEELILRSVLGEAKELFFSQDFQESANAFAEKRETRSFEGR